MKKVVVLLGMVLLLTFVGCGYADTHNHWVYNHCEERNPILGIADVGWREGGIAFRETALLGGNSVTHRYNDFIMTLNADRRTYSTSDSINIWGTLEYIGDYDTKKIWHGCPPMLFLISGGDEIDFGNHVGGGVRAILKASVLERGKVYHFEYQKCVRWNADDPNAEFWENFAREEELLLPVGEYTITLIGGFSLSESVSDSESGLKAELTIVVTE